MLRVLTALCMYLALVTAAPAEMLSSLLSSGQVAFSSVRGTGSSSGSSLYGTLVNRTGSEVEVDVMLREPVYFKNRGVGQNMIATQIYGSDGGYYRDAGRSFVAIPANGSMEIMLVAYCADFELDNPTRNERLAVAPIPRSLDTAARRIAAYEAANPNADTLVPAQLALWLAQGLDPAQIRQQFSFSNAQLAEAWSILR